MGLKLLPENSQVFIWEKSNVDDWGLTTLSGVKKCLSCFLRESEETATIESIGGKQVLPSYSLSFNGNVEVKVGDKIEVEGAVMEVLRRKVSKDLSGNVLLTKITV